MAGPRWSCPQHSCAACARRADAVGGMLFRCEGCAHAYCEVRCAVLAGCCWGGWVGKGRPQLGPGTRASGPAVHSRTSPARAPVLVPTVRLRSHPPTAQDHLPGGEELDIVRLCQRFAALGYRQPAAACYVRCTPQCGQLVEGLSAKAGRGQGGGGRR